MAKLARQPLVGYLYPMLKVVTLPAAERVWPGDRLIVIDGRFVRANGSTPERDPARSRHEALHRARPGEDVSAVTTKGDE